MQARFVPDDVVAELIRRTCCETEYAKTLVKIYSWERFCGILRKRVDIMHLRFQTVVLFTLLLFLSACSPGIGAMMATPTPKPPPTHTPIATDPAIDVCPVNLRTLKDCYTPHALRAAYDLERLTQQGFTGKGQTVVDIVSYGSPTLQQDMDVFSKQFDLPPITLQILSPLGSVPFAAKNKDMVGWAYETELDVQIIHAIAPDAGIVVMTSPVDEPEGTVGLPDFLKLEQYAIDHRLGNIISQSWGASEATLKDAAGQQEVQKWDAFFQKATTQQGMTYFASSGDNGATDFTDLQATK